VPRTMAKVSKLYKSLKNCSKKSCRKHWKWIPFCYCPHYMPLLGFWNIRKRRFQDVKINL